MKQVDCREKANDILSQISVLVGQAEALKAQSEEELKAIRDEYGARTESLKEALKVHEKDLVKLMKKNKGDLFSDADKVKLESGILLYGKEDKVSIPRDALGIIEELGWKDGLNVVTTINRPVIEKWPEERLAAIGAERKPKETYSYELKE